MIDERTEQLINRKLDGELSEAESLDLNRALIRSPEARALLEQYARTDGLATEALAAALSEGSRSVYRPAEIEAWASPSHRWWTKYRRGLGIAVAAAIAALVAGLPQARLGPVAPEDYQQAGDAIVQAGVSPFAQAGAQPVVDGPRRLNEQIDREVIAVYDEQTQSVYLLEMDQVRSKTEPVWKNY